jgi:FAD-dependent urate hydroxylase
MYSYFMTYQPVKLGALIIGGGVAGPVTAMALQKAGIPATIYEAYDRASDGVGAFLTLAVNGLDALKTLHLDQRVRAAGFDTPRFAMYTGSGRKLADMANGIALDDGTVSQTIERAELYSALRDEAVQRGVAIHYGKRLVDATIDGREVVASFADGSQAYGDLLIGADGLRSRTRTVIDPGAPPARYVGLLNAGGYANGVKLDAAPGVMHMVFGKRCFLGYVVHPDGDVWWFANPPQAEELSPDRLAAISSQEWRTRLRELFADDQSPALSLIDATPEVFAGWNTYDLPNVPTWHRDRMIIVGDAAHATSPASGQGASMAIEDALVLARSLRDADGITSAFARYEHERRVRVERVVAQGKRNGDQKAPGPIGRLLRDYVILPVGLRFAERLANSQRWMFDHHIEWDLQSGLEGVEGLGQRGNVFDRALD